MNRLTKQELIDALHRVGLQRGDLVLVHSDLRPFRLPVGIEKSEQVLTFYFEAFQEVLGKSGTLAVPAYFYEYARYGEPFDIDHSPVSKPLGVFSNFVAFHPGRVRSANPLQSLAAIGGQAEMLCGGTSLAGYGLTSPWQRLLDLNGKMLFLGLSIQPMTFVHHIEQLFGVPHRYCKMYPYPVLKNGQLLAGQPTSAVRYLEFGVDYQLASFQAELESRGLLQQTDLLQGSLLAVGSKDCLEIGLAKLQEDPFYFLREPPRFVRGQIPMDGIK